MIGGMTASVADKLRELIVNRTLGIERHDGAIRADDPGTVEGRVEGERLVILAGPVPMPSLRITLDDLLACIQAASGATAAMGSGEVE